MENINFLKIGILVKTDKISQSVVQTIKLILENTGHKIFCIILDDKKENSMNGFISKIFC